jgi:putative ABC transport system permease protein
MLKHYVLLALRNARRAPLVAAVNVLTLALGLACFLIVYAFVAFWKGAESHFAKSDRIAVLTMSLRLPDNGFAFDDDIVTPEIAAQYLEADFPAIESVARAVQISDKATASSGDRATRLVAYAVDPEFLGLFDLPFVAGDARRALAEPRSVVVTKATAAQLFGAEDPVGRSVLLENVETTVTGVIDAVPEPSHMGRSKTAAVRFELLASRDVIETIRAQTEAPNVPTNSENWVQGTATTYVLLPADGSLSIAALRSGLEDFVARHVPKETREFLSLRYGLVPVRDVLMKSVDGELFFTDVGMSVASLLLVLAGLVLAVACVNYVNLATARAAARLREVGLRKALGARPAQLMLQYLGEAGLAALAAAALALGVLSAVAPLLAQISGADLRVVLFAGPWFWLSLATLVSVVALVGGAYPAFALSRIEPAHAIRASRSVIGPRRLATLLVGSQFAVASFLLIAVTITAMQNAALRRTGLNAAADPLVVIDNTSLTANVDRRTLRAELLRHPAIKSVTELDGLPWASLSAGVVKPSPGDAAVARTVLTRGVGFDFFATFGIEPIAGRVFDREFGDEASPARGPVPNDSPIVVDRAFTEAFGFESPQAAVDQVVYFPSDTSDRPGRIVGVVENRIMVFFNIGELRASIYSLRENLPYEIVRVSKDDVSGALGHIDSVWKRLAPSVALERMFLDDVFNRVYETYAQISRVFSGLAAIAFLISVTGLFGTATLVAGRRTREIGVRKAHGASTERIAAMLLAHFTKPVVIASVVVWPLAFIAARAYLDTFLQPIRLDALPFVASLVATCGIAWLAVGLQTMRAARMRPADVLRHE